MNNTDLKSRLNTYAQNAEKALGGYLKESTEDYKVLIEAMRYSLLGGGKRIRAALCQEFCRICGKDEKIALPFACAVEMVHAYSLIHDDLPCMDNDDMRRGKPSCHVAFTEDTALLAGDALQTFAFETALSADSEEISPKNIIKAASQLAKGAGCNGMCAGQVLDLLSEKIPADEQRLREIQSHKTGDLIITACLMGCYAADANEQQISAAITYADCIGAAFQMVDDVLDVTSTEEELGKPIGSDEQNNKTTYVTLFGVEETMEKTGALTEKAKTAVEIFGKDGEFLKQLADYLLYRKN